MMEFCSVHSTLIIPKDEISIRYVDVLIREGWDEFKGYNLSITPSVIVDGSIILEFKDITTESLRESIERIRECS